MTLFEAIKSGLPHKRKSDDYVYFVPHVGGIGYSQADVMAEDWEVSPNFTRPQLKTQAEIIPIRRGKRRKK